MVRAKAADTFTKDNKDNSNESSDIDSENDSDFDGKATNAKKKKGNYELSYYSKRRILAFLKAKNYKIGKNTENFFKDPRKRPVVLDFIKQQTKKVEIQVANNYIFDDFKNVNNWLEYMKQIRVDRKCNYEIPLLYKMIAETETHPNPANVDGIDFRNLYNMLSSMMMGDPIEECDCKTSDYLQNVYVDCMSKLNEGQFQEDLKILRKFINSSGDFVDEEYGDNEVLENLKNLFSDPGLNPMSIPFNLLINKKF